MPEAQDNAAHNDIYWMRKALLLAGKAAKQDEVPVGALVVVGNQLISTGFNKREKLHSPLAHAEMIAIQKASKKMKKWRLSDATLYVTLEPCLMCTGLLVQARIGRLVCGALDAKGGAVFSLYQIPLDKRLNHRFAVTGGVLEAECGQILSDFFRKKRQEKA
jgi:tRNA(adenine34) deaminase